MNDPRTNPHAARDPDWRAGFECGRALAPVLRALGAVGLASVLLHWVLSW